jgi:hypothetical protein
MLGQGQRADALGGIHVAELAGHGSGSAVYLIHEEGHAPALGRLNGT